MNYLFVCQVIFSGLFGLAVVRVHVLVLLYVTQASAKLTTANAKAIEVTGANESRFINLGQFSAIALFKKVVLQSIQYLLATLTKLNKSLQLHRRNSPDCHLFSVKESGQGQAR